jgi:tRNA U55 pseudouridine synthase TruB
VNTIDLLDYAAPTAVIRIDCGGGTYIRSIARDLGQLIGCGCCLSALVREKSGPFLLRDSVTLAQLEAAVQDEEALAACFTQAHKVLADVAGMFVLRVDASMAKRIGMGQRVQYGDIPQDYANSEKRILVLSSESLSENISERLSESSRDSRDETADNLTASANSDRDAGTSDEVTAQKSDEITACAKQSRSITKNSHESFLAICKYDSQQLHAEVVIGVGTP